MTSCSGLPLCLSGIQIMPQACARKRSSHLQPPRMRSADPDDRAVLASESFSSSMCIPPCSDAISSTDLQREGNCGHSLMFAGADQTALQAPQDWPRFAVAKEMADLDRRREALKKQRRLRNNSAHQVRGYRLSFGHSDFMLAVLEAQSRLWNSLDLTEKGVCAKAA